MEVFELLEIIRKNPSLCVHDKKSLKELHAFLAGYETGVNSCRGTTGVFGDLRPFSVWLAKELGFSGPTSGWCNMISSTASSDEKAFDVFSSCLIDIGKRLMRNKDHSETPDAFKSNKPSNS